jgi:sulfide:quinone oxidoreductase
VGAGIKPLADSAKPMQDVMPKNAAWIKNSVTKIDPDANAVFLDDGRKVRRECIAYHAIASMYFRLALLMSAYLQITYEFLVVAPGLQLNWDKVKGLPETLGKNGVSSNYANDAVEKTWENLKSFRGGTAVFTMPSTPIKVRYLCRLNWCFKPALDI